jgi:hypothetical protein
MDSRPPMPGGDKTISTERTVVARWAFGVFGPLRFISASFLSIFCAPFLRVFADFNETEVSC